VLRILLVEDNRDDADLVRFALEDAGLVFELLRVGDEAALREAVASFAPDAAACDLNLPGYSGLAALVNWIAFRRSLPRCWTSPTSRACPPCCRATRRPDRARDQASCFIPARICASTATMAVMFTTRREVAAGVRICAGWSSPIRIGPIATPPVATRIRL
jgi:hypothetical protein